jgi:hypothetical protein
LGAECYGNVRPLGLGNGAFDNYMIYFSIIVLALSLGVKVGIGTFGNCKDCAMGLGRLCLAARVLGFVAEVGVVDWLHFLFGVIVLHWVGNLQNCWGIYNVWRWKRVCYLWS